MLLGKTWIPFSIKLRIIKYYCKTIFHQLCGNIFLSMARLEFETCHLTENGCSLAFNLRIKKFKLEIKNKIKNSLTNPLFLCTTSESWHRQAKQKRKCEKSRNTFFSKNGFSFLVLSKLTFFFHWIWSSPFPFCRRPERNN